MTVAKAVEALHKLYEIALPRVREKVIEEGKISSKLLNEQQLAAHALAYMRTDLEACKQLADWAQRVGGDHALAIASTYVGESVRTIAGGISLGPAEHIALADLGLTEQDLNATVMQDDIQRWAAQVASGQVIATLGRSVQDLGYGDPGLGDETLDQMRSEFRKFADREVIPIAQGVHQRDILIPTELVEHMAELGVFGLTIPEEHGGLELSKVAMCVVTEELSRGYIGVGSLGTRAEIAAELIVGAGTDEQKAEWLPKIASGEVLPTAVFTEPQLRL